MKILGRILIILAAFTALSILMTIAVNASGASSSVPDFNGASPQFQGQEGGREGFRPERGEMQGRGGGWMFGLTKNLFLIALLVTLIVLPKSLARSKRKKASASAANGGG